jgi:hypothetical protein
VNAWTLTDTSPGLVPPEHNHRRGPRGRSADQGSTARGSVSLTTDGDDVGEAEYSYQPNVGDEIYADGNRRLRVLAYVPLKRIEEFVDRPLYGVLEVEALAVLHAT